MRIIKLLPELLIVGMLGLLSPDLAEAQQIQQTPSVQTVPSNFILYRSTPVWKDMIDDPNVNYFEVQKAFDLFWEGREIPEGEDDVIGENHRLKNNLANKLFNAKELKEQQRREALSFDCKRYRWWLIKTEPFVQEDGSIMPLENRLELWKRHYEELKEQENK